MNNLKELFEIQAGLDAEINKNHPREKGENRELKKLLALQVEIGELANELPEVFKFWSNKKNNREKALKEYVDGTHFIISFALEFGIDNLEITGDDYTKDTTLETFAEVYAQIAVIQGLLLNAPEMVVFTIKDEIEELFNLYVGLAEKHLGFTWDEIVKAYLEKNQENHYRQMNGY